MHGWQGFWVLLLVINLRSFPLYPDKSTLCSGSGGISSGSYPHDADLLFSLHTAAQEAHCIGEQHIARRRLLISRPPGMVRPVIICFRMGHKTEYASGGVGKPGHCQLRAIGIVRVLLGQLP